MRWRCDKVKDVSEPFRIDVIKGLDLRLPADVLSLLSFWCREGARRARKVEMGMCCRLQPYYGRRQEDLI